METTTPVVAVTPVVPSAVTTTLVVAPSQTVESLKAELEALKAQVKATQPVAPPAPTPMTLDEAKALVASFVGKRGRRPEAFYEATELINASLTPEDKAAAKEAAKQAKVNAKKGKLHTKALAKANKAKIAADKAAAVFNKLDDKYEALKAKADALAPSAPPAA